jgi:hypothetical protein
VTENDKNTYAGIGAVVAFISFVAAYIYCIIAYGFLLGLGFGWIPSLIFAVIMFFLWPFAVLGIIGLLILFVAIAR